MMTEKIKIALIKRNKKATDLAKELGSSPTNLYNKFKRDNFSEKELMEIAEILNCNLKITFVMKDTGEEI